ncbi:hypothetical protein GCM10023311_00430 [Flaviramulus aquimarinus]|uniref:Carrier domain-containing protein n=1 Tax=Flaviramulus aquimarinus TaxID=1170456 RepID=A0ABP9EPN0_9FLAO
MDINGPLLEFIKNEIIEDNQLELGFQDDLFSTGLVDSMGMMRIISFVEKKLKTEVPFEDMTVDNFMTIEAISKYVSNKTV